MKIFYCALALLSAATVPLLSQSDAIKNLEKMASAQTGEDLLRNSLTLSEWYFNEQFYQKSADWAEKAYGAAKKSNMANYMAIALHQQGLALAKIPGKRDGNKAKAIKSFMESNRITTDDELKLKNLEQMRDLAVLLDRKKDLERIKKEIAALTGEDAPTAVGAGGLFTKRKREMEEFQKVKSEKEALSTEVSSLTEEQQKLEQQKKRLEGQQRTLQTLLVQREAAIQNMTAAQMKQQLLFSEQERIVDSLAFASVMDSMELSQKEMVLQQQKAEIGEKEAALKLQKTQRNLLLALAGIILLVAVGIFSRYNATKRHNAVLAEKNKIIEQERKRSEELLLNILPGAIAEELKRTGTAEARHYDNATVLFTDFKGFSAISKILTPEQLVHDLDYAFKNFDQIIGKFGLEKIKTIGDAYMCAGGIPDEAGNHPRNVVRAAIEIQEFLHTWNTDRAMQGLPAFEARIGIHTGPLVAGVVGSKKFAYDIWGDTVNIASRMESSGAPGKVNISSSTFSWVKNDYQCEYRGRVPAKNVGEIDMYFVEMAMVG